MVLGRRKGALVILPQLGCEHIRSSKEAPECSVQELLAEAHKHSRPVQGPWGIVVGRDMKWFSFLGWEHVHSLWGDPDTRRVHVLNRTLLQVPSCTLTDKNQEMYYYCSRRGCLVKNSLRGVKKVKVEVVEVE